MTTAGISRMLLENSTPKSKKTNPRLNKLKTKLQKKNDKSNPKHQKNTTTILGKKIAPQRHQPPKTNEENLRPHFALLRQGKTPWSQTWEDFVAFVFFGSRFPMLFRCCFDDVVGWLAGWLAGWLVGWSVGR